MSYTTIGLPVAKSEMFSRTFSSKLQMNFALRYRCYGNTEVLFGNQLEIKFGHTSEKMACFSAKEIKACRL